MTFVLAAVWIAAAVTVLLLVLAAILRKAARYLIEEDCDD